MLLSRRLNDVLDILVIAFCLFTLVLVWGVTITVAIYVNKAFISLAVIDLMSTIFVIQIIRLIARRLKSRR
jgi:hypothetical protein